MMSGGFGMGFGGGFMLLFWILLIVALAWLVKALVGRDSEVAERRTALEILDERYASGEIDEAAYRRVRADLEAK